MNILIFLNFPSWYTTKNKINQAKICYSVNVSDLNQIKTLTILTNNFENNILRIPATFNLLLETTLDIKDPSTSTLKSLS